MKRSKFTEAQIAFILRQGAEGTAVGEVFRILVFEGGVIRSLLPGVDPPFHPLRACPQPSG